MEIYSLKMLGKFICLMIVRVFCDEVVVDGYWVFLVVGSSFGLDKKSKRDFYVVNMI